MNQTEKKPKKILLVLYYYLPYVSGVSVYAKQVAEGLVAAGYEVTVLTARFDSTLPKDEVINKVKVIRRPVWFKLGKGVIMPLYWLDIIRFARSHDYVNPHLPLAESGLASLFIRKQKIVTTYQCDIYLGPGIVDRLVTFISLSLMKLQLWRSRAIVVLNQDYIDHSKMKSFANKAVPIYAPIAINDFRPTESSSFFKRLKIQPKTVKIGFIGRIVYEKGIEYLLGTIPYLQKTFPDFKIVIAGDFENVAGGSIKDSLDNFLEKYPDNIVFTGFLTEKEKHQFYTGIDVFVLPSIDPLEAFGMVQVEALLCGTPTVASDMPGVREVVNVTGYGRIAKPKNSKSLAKEITTVLQNPTKYKPDRKTVVKIFNPDETIKQYSELLP